MPQKGEYRRAEELAPDNAESWLCLAQLAGERGDLTGAIASWEKVLEVVPHSRQTEAPAAIHRPGTEHGTACVSCGGGRIPEFEAPMRRPGQPRSSPSNRPAGQKVGLNDPCPCGSGKKYKQCHGRKG